MPYKPTSEPEDYPERYQRRPDIRALQAEQERRLREAIGEGLFEVLSLLEKEKRCLMTF